MSDDDQNVLRVMAGQIAAMQADLRTLVEDRKSASDDRVKVHSELGDLKTRLTVVELNLKNLLDQRRSEAPLLKRVGVWLSVAGVLGAVALAALAGLIPGWVNAIFEGRQ